MDWARAIERNSKALTGILAALFAMLGLASGAKLGRIERGLYRAVLRILRPAESAFRRLIVIAARGLVVKPSASRPMPKGLKIAGRRGGSMAFQLRDPPERFRPWRRKPIPENRRPRVRLPFDERPPGTLVFRPEDFGKPEPVADDGKVDASRLARRLGALKQALADIPRQAKRLARWRMRRQAMAKLASPLRIGHPPGSRRKPTHDVDAVLTECDWLAHDALRLDTS
jgi:hypothetical protein